MKQLDLIRIKLYINKQLKKNNILLMCFDVNDYIEKVASSNGMDLYSFKSSKTKIGSGLKILRKKRQQSCN